jgi:hypothetical protein
MLEFRDHLLIESHAVLAVLKGVNKYLPMLFIFHDHCGLICHGWFAEDAV